MTRQFARRPSALRLEPLEPRDAPATLVSPTKLTYQDADGDNVAVSFSKPILNATNVNTIFKFDTGVVDGSNATRQQLRTINLTTMSGPATGTSITLTATRSLVNGGDGFAAVGQIDGTGIDLGVVTIDGDLGRIAAGDATTATTGLKGLTALSLGRFGTATGAADLSTLIQGTFGFLKIKSDVKEASIEVQGGANGRIRSVVIGGSLIGGDTNNSGRIGSTGDMGFVNVRGSLTGGGGIASGEVVSLGRLARVTIGGSVRGGGGFGSGRVLSTGDMGFVTVRRDLAGGDGEQSGEIDAGARLAGASVGGSIVGGAGVSSGQITSTGDMGPVTIRGDLIGGVGPQSGEVIPDTRLAGITVGGSVMGGAGDGSGEIASANGDMGFVTVHGSVTGASGAISGSIVAVGKLAGAKIGGSVQGGNGDIGGRVISTGDMGPVTVTGSLIGGAGNGSGQIIAGGTMKATVIGGDVVGGSAAGTATLSESGFIRGKHIANLTIGGSLIAGTDNTSGFFQDNGAVQANDDIGSLLIKGSVVGNATSPALIFARGSAAPTTTTDVAIGSLRVLGRVEFGKILAGVLSGEIAVNADAQIGSVFVGKDWIASSIAAGAIPGPNNFFGDGDDAKMSGIGIKDDPSISSKIGNVAIGGQVIGTVGGTDHFGIVAEIVGAVKVNGSSLPLTAGKSNDDVAIGITGDFEVNEV